MEMMAKRFEELSLDELYSIMSLRVQVFVVEQNCPYLELDGHDRFAWHVWLQDEEGIQAYLRVLDPGRTFNEASIGRVITNPAKRRGGLGSQVLQRGIELARQMDTPGVRIGAQTYARKLYERQGFVQSSEEFLEDGIPHIEMYLKF